MIGSNAGLAIHEAALQEFENGIALEPGHKKDALCPEDPKPGIADEALVKDHDGAFGQLHSLSYAAFMDFGVGDGCESRDMAIVIQQGMYFDAALGLPKRGPGKKRQAKLYGGGVQTEQFGFETEFVLRGFCGAQAVHLGEQILEKAYGARIVRVSKGRAGHVFQSPVIQAVSRSLKAAQAIAHGTSCGKLDEGHDRELLLETELTRRAPGFVPSFEFLKNMSGNQR